MVSTPEKVINFSVQEHSSSDHIRPTVCITNQESDEVFDVGVEWLWIADRAKIEVEVWYNINFRMYKLKHSILWSEDLIIPLLN